MIKIFLQEIFLKNQQDYKQAIEFSFGSIPRIKLKVLFFLEKKFLNFLVFSNTKIAACFLQFKCNQLKFIYLKAK
jgi:hypothetical protein